MARECIPGCDPADCQCSAPASGGFRRARGMLASVAGDELPEATLRRLRDGWDWPDIDEQMRNLVARIRQREERYGIAANDVHAAIDAGRLVETLDVCDWLIDIDLLRRIRGDEQECAVCGGPWDGHVTTRELTGPVEDAAAYRICGPCDRGEHPEYEEVSGGMAYVRSEQRDGSVAWGWAFVSRTPEDEQARAQRVAMRNPEAYR